MSNSQFHQRDDHIEHFFDACATGRVDVLRGLLVNDPSLARGSNPKANHQGWTGLHAAAKGGHGDAVRLLLEHGADPNAREAGDNTYALHWAAAHGHLEIVRALLDAGGDVHGIGDVHELDVIGWATFYRAPGDDPAQMDVSRRDLVSLLLERGAQPPYLLGDVRRRPGSHSRSGGAESARRSTAACRASNTGRRRCISP